MTHYDSYGQRDIYIDRIAHQPHRYFIDRSIRTGHYRFMVWVDEWRSATGSGGVAQRRTYRTRTAAIRQARRIRALGHGVRVADRMIRRGTTGCLADRSGSYWRDRAGVLRTGTRHEIQKMREEQS